MEQDRVLPSVAGPWYTLTQALQKLDMFDTELRFAIQQDDIQAIALTPTRNFLLFNDLRSNWRGHCVCRYSGPLTLHKNFVLQLFDGETISIGKSWVRLIESGNVTHIDERYPFKRALPHPPLIEWEPYSPREQPVNHFCATPLPSESHSTSELLGSAIKNITATLEKKAQSKKESDGEPAPSLPNFNYSELELHLHFNQSEFQPGCLRIPKSEIDRYLSQDSVKSCEEQLPEQIENPNPVQVSTKSAYEGRENQFHSMLERIVRDNPEITAKMIWKMLKKECGLVSPKYDTARILDQVTENSIHWTSRDNNRQTLAWISLPSRLSRIKKRISTDK